MNCAPPYLVAERAALRVAGVVLPEAVRERGHEAVNLLGLPGQPEPARRQVVPQGLLHVHRLERDGPHVVVPARETKICVSQGSLPVMRAFIAGSPHEVPVLLLLAAQAALS